MAKPQKQVSFKTELIISTTGSGWHFLLVNKDIVAKLGFEDKYRRVVCTMNKTESFQCALLPWGDLFYIIVNKKKREAAGIVVGDMVDVSLVKDESKYGLPMPEELQEVLNQDEEGSKLFQALTNGKQRTILYYVAKYKDIDRRIASALIIIEHLKNNDGKIDYRRLYQELRVLTTNPRQSE